MSDLGYSLVPVDHDPFVDQLPPSQAQVTAPTSSNIQADEIAKLASKGTSLSFGGSFDNPQPKVTYDEAKSKLYGLTGIPDIQQGAEEFSKGNYLAGIGQAGAGALQVGALALPAARVAGGVLKEAIPAIPEMMANTEGTFLGTKARLANQEALTRAQALEDKGMRNEDIRQATGWMRGIDDQWRFEHSDIAGKITGPKYYEALDRSNSEIPTGSGVSPVYRKGPDVTIGDLYHDPKLWENYPEIARYPIEELPQSSMGNMSAAFSPSEKKFYISQDALESGKLKQTALHEIQHAIQHREGFAGGGNLSEFLSPEYHQRALATTKAYDDFIRTAWDDYKIKPPDAHDMIDAVVSGKVSPDDFHYEFAPKLQALKDNIDRQLLEHNQAYEKYRKFAGESESRLVEARSGLPEWSQRAISPFPMHSLSGSTVNARYSFDVPPAEQVVRFKVPYEEGLQASEKPPDKGNVSILPNLISPELINRMPPGEENVRFPYQEEYPHPKTLRASMNPVSAERLNLGRYFSDIPRDMIYRGRNEQTGINNTWRDPNLRRGGLPGALIGAAGASLSSDTKANEPAPGIHYLEDEPSSNYVINSPQLIDIVKKHGVGVLHSSGFPLGTYFVPVDRTPDFGNLHGR